MVIQIQNSKSENRKVRIGIDVGGTFTDVVVVDNDSREVVSQLKVPTTHSAKEGVALGIINAIERVLSELKISPDDVIFIAHSTTQADKRAARRRCRAASASCDSAAASGGASDKIASRIPLAAGIALAPAYLEAQRKVAGKNVVRADAHAGHQHSEARWSNRDSEAFDVDPRRRNQQLRRDARARKGNAGDSGDEGFDDVRLAARTSTAALKRGDPAAHAAHRDA